MTCTLICFPYAGGTASVFKEWGHLLGPDIQLLSIEMPGRGTRSKEKPCSTLAEAVDDVMTRIMAALGGGRAPVVLFGHSMGALIAYEVGQRLLTSNQGADLLGIVMSAKKPPHLPLEQIVHELPDQLFKERIIAMGGIPRELESVLPLFIPMLRNDFRMVEQYEAADTNKQLTCPIYTFRGIHDGLMSEEEVAEWGQYTAHSLKSYNFDGGHLFINQCADEVCQALKAIISAIKR
ncbi:surfactin synthase thioesterase subunit [Paenibacillus cellulosilyticus]|uniref:Surfactin synthase thioesterase subunit n=1 Tax=Paenibacillus cellulosilyticus TaxID=375489 RepID=A0A2V2YZ79_9BACL|nr:alpha/beta fold hydrolase [Paenibacillus cellulosilyticus]PWW06125.1 surfactin synthase thioesterase subunit [Paenibacillus cellulosilyticus]QKS43102.1 thioesterase [Paenibacillus cellulosilyticus]